MKFFRRSSLSVLFLLSAFAFWPVLPLSAQKNELPPRQKSWKSGPNQTWFLHLTEAQTDAKRKKRPLFVIVFDSEERESQRLFFDVGVFSSEPFRAAARGMTLLHLDMSADKTIPARQKKHNEIARKKLDAGDLPVAVILDPDGKLRGKIQGFYIWEEYMRQLTAILTGQEPEQDNASVGPAHTFTNPSSDDDPVLFFEKTNQTKFQPGEAYPFLIQVAPGIEEVRFVPIADEWESNSGKILLQPEQKETVTYNAQLQFPADTGVAGLRILWKEFEKNELQFREEPLSLSWGTGKGPLAKSTLALLDDGQQLLDIYQKNDLKEFSRLLQDGVSPRARIFQNDTPPAPILLKLLFDSVKNKNADRYLNALIKAGANPKYDIVWSPFDPWTDALLPMLEKALKLGADPNNRKPYGLSALHALSRQTNTTKSVQLVLKYKADPNERVEFRQGDNREFSPILSSFFPYHSDTPSSKESLKEINTMNREKLKNIAVLLSAGANPNAVVTRTSTDPKTNETKELLRIPLLHLLAQRGDTPAYRNAIRLLLKHGADPNAQDHEGNSLMNIGNETLKTLLQNYKKDPTLLNQEPLD